MKKFKTIIIAFFILTSVLLSAAFFGGCDFVQYVKTEETNVVSDEVKKLREDYVNKLYLATAEIKFRDKEQKLYEYALQDAVNELNECNLESELKSVFDKHLTAIGEIKTDGEYSYEEETAAINAYRTAVLNQADESYDRDKYHTSQITYLNFVFSNFSANLFDSSDKEEMNVLLQNFYFDIYKEDEILSLINYADIEKYDNSLNEILTKTLNSCIEDIRICGLQENIAEIQEVYEFEVYRCDTINKINNYINLNLYREEQAKGIEDIKKQQLSLVKNATTDTECDNLFREYQIAVYNIPTDEMLYGEELNALKEELKSTLENTYNISLYRANDGITVKELLASFRDTLELITKKEDALSQYFITKNRIDEVKTDSRLSLEEREALIEESYDKIKKDIIDYVAEEKQDEYFLQAESVYESMKDRLSIHGIREEYLSFARGIGVIRAFAESVEFYNEDKFYRSNEQTQVDAIKQEYLSKFTENLSVAEAENLFSEAKGKIDKVKTNDDYWNESVESFRTKLHELYGDAILEEPRSLTSANDYTELANIIDYYAFYQLSGTEFVCDTFRVKLNFAHGDATYVRNEVYWHCELLKSAVDIQAEFDYNSDYIIFSLTAYDFATESNRDTTEEKIKAHNITDFSSDKSNFSKREDDFEGFPFNDYDRQVKVYNSQQLWYALEHKYKPVCEVGSVAESILNEAKQILRSIIMEGMSYEEKIYKIYSWIGENIQFDNQQTNYNYSSDPENYPNERISSLRSHFIEGGIFDKLTVCIGFSKTYLMLLCMEGIDAKLNIARMPYMKGLNTINSMAWSFHTYVYIKINNKWYYSDSEKSDDRANGTYSLNYIMLPKSNASVFDEHMNKDLTGGADLDYYKHFEVLKCKTYVSNKDELQNVLNTIKNNNFKTPFSVFAGYNKCYNDIIEYCDNESNLTFNIINNNSFELIIQLQDKIIDSRKLYV